MRSILDMSGENARVRSVDNASYEHTVENASPQLDDSHGTARLGDKVQVADRLLAHLDSFLKWELLRFLHSNPDTAATVEELARYTGRDETELKPAVRALASAGIVQQKELSTGNKYSLTKDDTMRQLINHLVRSYLDDRLARSGALNLTARTQRRAPPSADSIFKPES